MNTPEYPPVKELCETIQSSQFQVKMRGYAPKEVDEFMDKLVERLTSMEAGFQEVQRYDTWLRMEVHSQVVSLAQQEAQKIMQDAQDQARALTENARADMERERAEAARAIREYTDNWNVQKQQLDRELSELRQQVKDYRTHYERVLRDAMDVLQHEQRQEEAETVSVPMAVPPMPTPGEMPAMSATETRLNSAADVERLLEDIKRKVR